MEMTMKRETVPNTKAEWLREAELRTYRAYTWFRNLGYSRDAALANSSDALGLTPRRVRSLLESEPVQIAENDYNRLCFKWHRHLEEKARVLRAELEATETEIKQMRLL